MNNIDDFNDLLDDVIEKETKNISGLNDNKSGGNQLKSKKESFELFDEPKPKSNEKSAGLTLKNDPPAASPAKSKRWG